VHCQVETLRRCFPPSIRHILGELPKTLDETYERILLEIDGEKQPFAHRLFQCLVISIRPLRVEELAELFAVLPDTDSTPGFNVGWRPEDPEEFILSACSTLVAIVEVHDKKVVQFSHFSVREYLTSNRISNSAPISHFHVLPKPAHTLLAKACLSVLIQLDRSIDETNMQNFPLAEYAAEHWVDHTRFEDISSDIQDGVDCLFDRKKPHLAAWIWLYDVEDSEMRFNRPPSPTEPAAVPLYYAALCGIRDLVECLLDAHPQDLNTQGGYYKTPLLAALGKEHLNIALFLLERGADVEPQGGPGQTALYVASSHGYAELVHSLLDRGADLNAVCDDWDEDGYDVKLTPLLVALKMGRLEIARLLLESGADVERRGSPGPNALYMASSHGHAEFVRLLLDRGVDSNVACDDWDKEGNAADFTPLLVASQNDMLEVARLLLEQGADSNYQDDSGQSALHLASRHPSSDLARLLLEHRANPNAVNEWGSTALHQASYEGQIAVVALLLEYGANVNARNEEGCTPLHLEARRGHPEVVQLLLDRAADVNAHAEDGWTALHFAAEWGCLRVVEVLLERGADPHARTNADETAIQVALGSRVRDTTQVRRLLSERTGEGMDDVRMRD
jgi:ankyrin repeat protein